MCSPVDGNRRGFRCGKNRHINHDSFEWETLKSRSLFHAGIHAEIHIQHLSREGTCILLCTHLHAHAHMQLAVYMPVYAHPFGVGGQICTLWCAIVRQTKVPLL